MKQYRSFTCLCSPDGDKERNELRSVLKKDTDVTLACILATRTSSLMGATQRYYDVQKKGIAVIRDCVLPRRTLSLLGATQGTVP